MKNKLFYSSIVTTEETRARVRVRNSVKWPFGSKGFGISPFEIHMGLRVYND